ncbi:FAD-dependent oxidoreductase [Microbacterium sp. zg-Y818]|uniref:FAD-dependent oxidoreductase n=1 Tax=unclassified Microbacterium TaxID=2609290 RepID=UPI00214C5229|nr:MULTISPECIES: FAD-dependent oxidoreductase [unclassified Microbacterium]MCR2799381.1 FAD-dependent oxidoreductase [Microbacterium sp. zg.Y818]WIM21380.1 FAD-dependent oxidoreductase [Microbacterium sp. zg-Y818]
MPLPSPIADEEWTADVVVIGSGAAGAAAAITARDAGASVVILEKMDAARAGGNTRVSGGSWFHHDDPDGIARYLRALSGRRALPEPVVHAWAHGTRTVTEWMSALGVEVGVPGDFAPEYPELPGSEAYGGYRSVDGRMGDGRLHRSLIRAVTERGIPIRYGVRAVELVTDAQGGVIGVVTEDGSVVHARGGVVLATGGFEADAELVREHLDLEGASIWGSPACTGDGLRMAQRIGADLWHTDNMMAVTGITPHGSRHGLFAMMLRRRGYIWVDGAGERFVDETAPAGHGQALIDGQYVLKPDRPAWVVFDEGTRRAGPISPDASVYPVGWSVVMDGYAWSSDNTAEIAAGWILSADTLPELAAAIGVPAPALQRSVATYNDACAAGVDERFGRAPATLDPLADGPYYAFCSRPVLAWTNGGPRRDEHARVLRTSQEVIAGLYAAGGVSSTYSWAKDGGFHIADAITFGRIAGAHAATRAARGTAGVR